MTPPSKNEGSNHAGQNQNIGFLFKSGNCPDKLNIASRLPPKTRPRIDATVTLCLGATSAVIAPPTTPEIMIGDSPMGPILAAPGKVIMIRYQVNIAKLRPAIGLII